MFYFGGILVIAHVVDLIFLREEVCSPSVHSTKSELEISKLKHSKSILLYRTDPGASYVTQKSKALAVWA